MKMKVALSSYSQAVELANRFGDPENTESLGDFRYICYHDLRNFRRNYFHGIESR